jgi:hypothetical protein
MYYRTAGLMCIYLFSNELMCVSHPACEQGRVPELDRLRTHLESRARKVKAEGKLQ